MSNFLVQGGAPPDDSVTTVMVQDDAVTTAKIANDQVTLAKMAGLARGTMIYGDASGDPAALAVGAANEVLTHDGTDFDWAAAGGGFTLGTEVDTSAGTTATFAGIPAGTKMIVVMFEEVSFNSTNLMDVTIGDAGGLETTNYKSGSHKILTTTVSSSGNTTDAFIINKTQSGDILKGTMTLTLKDAANFTWIATHCFHMDGANISWGGGWKSLSAELTQVQVSGGTFNSGSINIMYI